MKMHARGEDKLYHPHSHNFPCGGKASVDKTMDRIFQASFCGPTLFKGVQKHVWVCDQFHMTINLSKGNEKL